MSLHQKENKLNPENYVQILRWRAENQGDKKAFTFITDGDKKQIELTYQQLDRKARAFAAQLQKKGLKGERALLLFPPGLDYIIAFLGCLYAEVLAVPAYPPDPNRLNRTLPRLQAIVRDAGATVALTNDSILYMIRILRMGDKFSDAMEKVPFLRKFRTTMNYFTSNRIGIAQAKELGDLQWISSDDILESQADSYKEQKLDDQSIAFLQYTSGSTGIPKGVIVTHNNLIVNSQQIKNGFGLNDSFDSVIWLPIYHDMGLIGGVLQPLYTGFHTTYISPIHFLQKPIRWLNAISKIKDNPIVSGGPNFAYDLCTRKVTKEQLTKLDLSNWKVAFSGAEPVRAETVNRFYDTFKSTGFKKEAFLPCYGLAEATLYVSGFDSEKIPEETYFDEKLLSKSIIKEISKDSPNAKGMVSCGVAGQDELIEIVNPQTFEKVKANEAGEIWLKGPNVAKGYWNREEATKETFQAFIKDTNEGPFLRTGDLGYLKNGQLYITGRAKDLIIIRGRNYYPQDIEFLVENAHEDIRPGCSAAFSIDENGEEHLVIVAEVRQKKNLIFTEIVSTIRQIISETNDIRVYKVILIKARSIAKTSSGKIQRHAVKSELEENKLKVVYSWEGSSAVVETPQELIEEDFIPEIPTAEGKVSSRELESWIIEYMAENLEISKREIDVNQPFASFGLDSAQAIGMIGDLEDYLSTTLSPTIIWDYPNIRSLSNHLAGEVDSSPLVVRKVEKKTELHEPIAVVGMALRFPGANTIDEFWKILSEGIDAITEVPPERWDIDDFYDPDPDAPGKMVSRYGGFLKDIDKFDPNFFGISPREAENMDPQQRILLEIFWEALESAGIPVENINGSKTGVFVGIGNYDYSHFNFGNFEKSNMYSGTGNAICITANRISYLFDLRGPSVAMDTACSSSMTAIHLASKSLISGESDLAVAGGANLILSPEVNIALSKARMLAPHGRCKTFDADAQGYVRSEGAALLILKRLSDAKKDRNNILALIRGSATNQDGKSNGITAPNRLQQVNVIRDAMTDAQISPLDVGYFETHGTGTNLGDPIEIQALAEVFAEKSKDNPLYLGSVKTNIGHLEAAAGIAGIIKIILAMNNKKIPSHLHFLKANPHIAFDKLPFIIPTELTDWQAGGKKRIANVSSFGFGGANVHVVLEEPPEKETKENKNDRPYHILSLSAAGEKALVELKDRFLDFLVSNKSIPLEDICYSNNTGRSNLNHRLTVHGKTVDQIINKLEKFQPNSDETTFNYGIVNSFDKPKTAFLFTGQGAQYPFMSKKLYDTQPAFKAAIDACANILDDILEKSLLDIIFPSDDNNTSDINITTYTQPALFTVEYALARLWQSWGVQPDYLIGHSVGEYVAACIAGVFSLEDGLKLIAARGRLMGSLPENGDMAAIFTDADDVKKALAGKENEISIAGVNGPGNTVISGTKKAIEEIIEIYNSKNVKTRKLTVSHAFHSPLMEPILDEFEKFASEIEFNIPRIPIVSNLTGKLLAKDQIPDATYWKRHIREGVMFADGMKTLDELKVDVFIETGPHPTLIGMGKFCISEREVSWIPSLKKDEDDWDILLNSLGKAFCEGFKVNWENFDRYYHRNFVLLPNYPFQRRKYWVDVDESFKKKSGSLGPSTEGHPLLGMKIRSPQIKNNVFEARFNSKSLNILNDHRIYGIPLMPATGYMEMALAAALKTFNDENAILKNLIIMEAIPIADEGQTTIQIILEKKDKKNLSNFQIYSLFETPENEEEEIDWILNASGQIDFSKTDPVSETELNNLKSEIKDNIDTGLFYKKLQEHGFEHGKSLAVIRQMWHKNDEALGYFELDSKQLHEVNEYIFHPALSDAGTQLLAATLSPEHQKVTQKGIFLPVGVEKLTVYKTGIPKLWCHIKRCEGDDKNTEVIQSDVIWYNDDGEIVAKLEGLKHMLTSRNALPKALQQNINDWLYEIEWKEKQADQKTQIKGTWLIFDPETGLSEKYIQKLQEQDAEIVRILSSDTFVTDSTKIKIKKDDPANYVKIFESELLANKKLSGIIYMWPLNVPESFNDANELETANKSLNSSYLNLIQGLASLNQIEVPRIFVVTKNSQTLNREKVNFAQGSIWGFNKVLSLEHPEYRATSIDIDGQTKTIETFISEIASNSSEQLLLLRGNNKFVQRLSKSAISIDGEMAADNNPIRLEIEKKGVLENLTLTPMQRQEPPKGVVEIEVFATGLNFRDVLNAMDLYPGDPGPLGGECSGIVSAVGEGVTNLKVGDAVMGIAGGSFASYVLTYADLVVKKPENISFEEAATIPITYLTAHYALNHLAKMKKGDRVFIHAASGGVGQAAIQLAKFAGAEIYGTAGSEEKRAIVKKLGAHFVMNSRTLDYAQETMNYSKGKGVNILLNSLNGEYIDKNLEILSPQAVFLEIGKIDIWDKEQIKNVRSDISYHTIAIDSISENQPATIQKMLREIVEMISAGQITPLQSKVYDIKDAEEAFRFMLQAKHIGKVIISQNKKFVSESKNQIKISAKNSYLVSGGLGALGLLVAKWLAANNAGNIILISRRKPNDETQNILSELEANGSKIEIINADVSDFNDLNQALDSSANLTTFPLHGIFHAAGVLDDGVIMQQNWDRFENVMASKVIGTYNLSKLSSQFENTFSVYFSSAASLIGSPGQSNYATANSFMDSLAYNQTANGNKVLSINWGPWSSGGMAANLARRNSSSAIGMIAPDQGIKIMENLLKYDLPQVGVLPIKWKKFAKQFSDNIPLFYENYISAEQDTQVEKEKSALVKQLEETDITKRKDILTEFLQNQTVRVLGLESESAVDISQPLQSMGLDSLMAIELKNSIDKGIGKKLPATIVFNYPTIEALSSFLLDEVLELGKSEEKESIAEEDSEMEKVVAEVKEMSDEEAEALLMKKLEEDDEDLD